MAGIQGPLNMLNGPSSSRILDVLSYYLSFILNIMIQNVIQSILLGGGGLLLRPPGSATNSRLLRTKSVEKLNITKRNQRMMIKKTKQSPNSF